MASASDGVIIALALALAWLVVAETVVDDTLLPTLAVYVMFLDAKAGTRVTPLRLRSLSAASLEATAAAIQTEITSPSDQLRLVSPHRYRLSRNEVAAALRADDVLALPMCNTQFEAAFPRALVKPRYKVPDRVVRLSSV